MDKPPRGFERNERDAAAEAIRAFCRGPAHPGGGIFLVAGPRGAGKSRLVDWALNHEPGETESAQDDPDCRTELRPGSWRDWAFRHLSPLFGDIPWRRRRCVKRAPRRVERILMPVAVDPFFPNAKGSEESPPDPEVDATNLLDNIIFGLTSLVDPRASAQRHGYTLRDRLGFWDYYFSPLAMYRPDGRPGVLGSALWLVTVLFPVAALAPEWEPLPGISAIWWPALGAGLVIVAWLVLRVRDWRVAAYRGGRLYDLVHAEDSEQVNTEVNERSWRLERQWTQGAGLLAAGTSLGLLLVAGAGSELTSTLENHTGALLALLGTGVAVIVFARSRTRKHNARFNGHRRAWRITLLRRYLFVLHRCGIEPVLVLDELDKLEPEDAIDSGRRENATEELGKKTPEPKEGQTDAAGEDIGARDTAEGPPTSIETATKAPSVKKKPGTPPLDRFEHALRRLKHSVGAEFLWILIGGQGLYSLLQEHRRRHRKGMVGPLATLIQGEVVVGSVRLTTALAYLGISSGEEDLRNSVLPLSSPTQEERELMQGCAAWIKERGIYSGLVRQAKYLANTTDLQYLELPWRLAIAVDERWNPWEQAPLLNLDTDAYANQVDSALQQKLKHDWTQTWIHSGMLELAEELLVGPIEGRYSRHEDIWRSFENVLVSVYPDEIATPRAITTGDAESLMELGRFILYTHLQAAYWDEGWGIREPESPQDFVLLAPNPRPR